MDVGEKFSFSRGDRLWAKGAASDELVAVCTGALGLRRGEGGRARLVQILLRGDLVGEEAAVGGARPAACVALTAGKACRVPRASLSRTLLVAPRGWQTLLEVSGERVASFASRLEVANGAPVAARLALLLADLGHRIGLADARGLLIPLRLGRQDLADVIGCREETVVRTMRLWDDDGLVSTLREGFILRQPDALRTLISGASTTS